MSTAMVRSSSTVKPAAVSIGPQSAPRWGMCSTWRRSAAAWTRSSRPGRSAGAFSGRKRGWPASSTTANRPPGASASWTVRSARSGGALGGIEADPHTRSGEPRAGQGRAYAVLDAAGACLGTQALKVVGGGVDGGDVRVGEAVEEGEGARAGAAAQVHDVVWAGLQRQPCGDGGGVLGEDLGVQVEDLGLAVGVDSVVVVLAVGGAVVRGVGVCVSHGFHPRAVMRLCH